MTTGCSLSSLAKREAELKDAFKTIEILAYEASEHQKTAEIATFNAKRLIEENRRYSRVGGNSYCIAIIRCLECIGLLLS